MLNRQELKVVSISPNVISQIFFPSGLTYKKNEKKESGKIKLDMFIACWGAKYVELCNAESLLQEIVILSSK